MSTEKCRNCGAGIGDLDTPYLWQERIVCRSCYRKLQPKRGASRGPVVGGAIGVAASAIVGGAFWLAKMKADLPSNAQQSTAPIPLHQSAQNLQVSPQPPSPTFETPPAMTHQIDNPQTAAVIAPQPLISEQPARIPVADDPPGDTASDRLRRAQEFYSHDLLPKAKETLIEIVYGQRASDDVRSQALYLLGQIAFDEQRFRTAIDDWSKLRERYPESASAKDVADRMVQLRDVVAKFSAGNLSSTVAQSYIQNGDFWSGAGTTFIIDTSWLRKDDLALEWYDKVLAEFPKTDAADLAYSRKLLTLLGWRDPGEYGESFGVKGDYVKYMPMVVDTFRAYERDFPKSIYLQAFRFQIAQAYWTKDDAKNAQEWLGEIVAAGGGSTTFYTSAAKARMNKLGHGE